MHKILYLSFQLICVASVTIVSVMVIANYFTNSLVNHSESYERNMSSVILRRKIYTNMQYTWNVLHNGLKIVEKNITSSKKTKILQESVKNIVEIIDENKRLLHSYIEQLAEHDGHKVERKKQSDVLSQLVQARLKYLQNPKNCSTARKLLCHLEHIRGFACHIHHVLVCLVYAYATERTLILNSTGWCYNDKGWEDVFQPLSDSCNISPQDSSYTLWPGEPDTQNLYLPAWIYPQLNPVFQIVAAPEDLANRVQYFHGDPSLWWLGQLAKYILRLNKKTENMIQLRMKEMGFQKPIVGIHVRRTDKLIKESKRYELSEYMEYADIYFKKLELTKPGERRIYLATDDPPIIEEMKKKYGNYSIITNPIGAKMAHVDSRYNKDSLNELLLDILLLARCDYLICTFTSNFGRLAYELMQAFHLDGSDQYEFTSLDVNYYYWGVHSNRFPSNYSLNPLDSRSSRRKLTNTLFAHFERFSSRRMKTSLISRYRDLPRFIQSDTYIVAKYPTYPQIH